MLAVLLLIAHLILITIEILHYIAIIYLILSHIPRGGGSLGRYERQRLRTYAA